MCVEICIAFDLHPHCRSIAPAGCVRAHCFLKFCCHWNVVHVRTCQTRSFVILIRKRSLPIKRAIGFNLGEQKLLDLSLGAHGWRMDAVPMLKEIIRECVANVKYNRPCFFP